jgi:UDP-glucose 4-epimerase
MKVMVIGGAGFIGSHVVDALVADGNEVAVVDNLFLGRKENINERAEFLCVDAANPLELKLALTRFRPTIVYNLAVLPLPHSIAHPHLNVTDNIQIVLNLLDAQDSQWFQRLIHFSSSEVYGSALYTPMCENHPLESSTPYAASKAACDLICLSYHRTFGNSVTIIRPFNNYGPRQNDASYAGIIPLTINRIKDGDLPVILGDGSQTRDFIYVKDTARAALMLLDRPDLDGEIINVASGKDVSIYWLVQKIQSLMCKEGEIEYRSERPGDVHRHIANVLKAKDLLGFEPIVSMEEGLKNTVEFYLQK